MKDKYGTKASKIPYLAGNRQPFMFVTLTSPRPLVTRQDLFWETARLLPITRVLQLCPLSVCIFAGWVIFLFPHVVP